MTLFGQKGGDNPNASCQLSQHDAYTAVAKCDCANANADFRYPKSKQKKKTKCTYQAN